MGRVVMKACLATGGARSLPYSLRQARARHLRSDRPQDFDFGEFVSKLARFDGKIVRGLHTKPEFRRGVEESGQAKRRIGCDRVRLGGDTLNTRAGYLELPCQRAGRHVERRQILLAEDFTRVDRGLKARAHRHFRSRPQLA